MAADFQWWVGIDWGAQAHQVCVVDAEDKVRMERAVKHTGDAIAQFIDELTALSAGDLQRMAASIETPRGAIVDTLLERGVAVFSLNPKQLDRFRDRYTVAGAKDDRRDARVLARSLRTDLPLFRRLQPGDPLVVQMRECVRIHAELTQESVALGNRLWEQLHRFYPQTLALGSLHDEPWIWTLIEHAPTPAHAQTLCLDEVQAILKQHRIRRVQAASVLQTLRENPLYVAAGVTEAAADHVALLLPRLRLVHAQQHCCQRKLEQLYAQLCDTPDPQREHRDAAILLSVPGLGVLTSATMLAEAWQPLADRDYRTLRALSGVAPVTRSSGTAGVKPKPRKDPPAFMRRACNGLLRSAVYHWAFNSTLRDLRSKQHYARLRAKGHSHSRAIRGVADRLLAMLVAMLRAGTPYDPARRAGAPVAHPVSERSLQVAAAA